mmetsp:Transcript_15379/g.28733  ORF Transcript_15379/g.28733 Transcript_15379/m.28733 type:complete len:216 (+) Transcript_15379:3123-3770(+)
MKRLVVVHGFAPLTGLAIRVVDVSDGFDARVVHPLKKLFAGPVHVRLRYFTVPHDSERRAVLDSSEGVVSGADVVTNLVSDDTIVPGVGAPLVDPSKATGSTNTGPATPGAVRHNTSVVIKDDALKVSADNLALDERPERSACFFHCIYSGYDVGVAALFLGEVCTIGGTVENNDMRVDEEVVVQLSEAILRVERRGVLQGLVELQLKGGPSIDV